MHWHTIVNNFFEEDEFGPNFWMKWLFMRDFHEALGWRADKSRSRLELCFCFEGAGLQPHRQDTHKSGFSRGGNDDCSRKISPLESLQSVDRKTCFQAWRLSSFTDRNSFVSKTVWPRAGIVPSVAKATAWSDL